MGGWDRRYPTWHARGSAPCRGGFFEQVDVTSLWEGKMLLHTRVGRGNHSVNGRESLQMLVGAHGRRGVLGATPVLCHSPFPLDAECMVYPAGLHGAPAMNENRGTYTKSSWASRVRGSNCSCARLFVSQLKTPSFQPPIALVRRHCSALPASIMSTWHSSWQCRPLQCLPRGCAHILSPGPSWPSNTYTQRHGEKAGSFKPTRMTVCDWVPCLQFCGVGVCTRM